MEEKIVIVLNEMSEYLSITQMKKLQEVIIKTFADNEASKVEISNEEFLKMFLDAKRIEGCSERTIIYYQATVKHLLSQITTEVRKITTEEIREYLSKYQKDIAGRYYQEAAVKAVCNSFDEKNRRKALLVMATGSGKTRTVIALCDCLLKAGWVKNILFLADRNSLVTQAKRSFVNMLPNLSCNAVA